MLHEWLAPQSVGAFLDTHLHRQPFARPDAARATIACFGWETLAKILAADPLPDVVATLRGRMVDVPAPRTVADARALMAGGVGFVIRRAERHQPDLADLAAAFADDLPGEVHLQLFVTPAGTHSFGWHYDVEDVFIVQTVGAKDYYFRANTVDPDRPAGARPDFALVRSETSPIGTARLLPGDWLYVPARWWHVAKCLEESLSISVGVLPHRHGARQA